MMRKLLLSISLFIALAMPTFASASSRAIAHFNMDSGQNATDASGNITMVFDILIFTPGQQTGRLSEIPVTFAPSDSLSLMASKITTAVQNAVQSYGFTLARTDILIEQFFRGV